MMTEETTLTDPVAEQAQPPLNDLQRAFCISAFDIPKNGTPEFKGCAEMAKELSLQSNLPLLEASSMRVLILEAPFSPKNPGVQTSMSNWFDQFKKTQPRRGFDLWDLRNLWAGRELCSPSQTFWAFDYIVRERRTESQGRKTLMKWTPFLEAQYFRYGRKESLRGHIWKCASSVNAAFSDDGRVQSKWSRIVVTPVIC